jgi:XTP/dITP diphosphohydrolase
MRLRFISSNPFKIAEVGAIFGARGIDTVAINLKIDELQTTNIELLVRDKCLKAYTIVGRPLFVEHTGLEINALNGFPGGLTQIFWDAIRADRFTELFGSASDPGVVAKTQIGYCDGKKIYQFTGEVSGYIPRTPAGKRDFQWDCVFVPEGTTKTFAEMGDSEKNKISMRKIALTRLAEFLGTAP